MRVSDFLQLHNSAVASAKILEGDLRITEILGSDGTLIHNHFITEGNQVHLARFTPAQPAMIDPNTILLHKHFFLLHVVRNGF